MSALPTCADESLHAELELTRLYEAHSSEILAFCRRQLSSQTDAEDATQTTFLYALRALRRGVVPDNEPAWLTAIAKNVCHTQRRTLDRRGPLAGGAGLDRIALAEPEEGDLELVAGLTAALRTLPENQRAALVLREWLGLTPSEIAPRLGLTPTATHALLTRARRSVVAALTTTAGRPLSALNVAVLADPLRTQLKALLAGASTKAAVGVAVVGVAAGGVVVERVLGDSMSPAPAGSTEQSLADASVATGSDVLDATDPRSPTPRRVPVGERGTVRGTRGAPATAGGGNERPTFAPPVDTASRPPALLPSARPSAATKQQPGTPGAAEDDSVLPHVVPPDPPALPELESPPVEIEPPPLPELPIDNPLSPLPPAPVEIPDPPLVPHPLG